MSTTDPYGVPQVEDKRTKPSGLLPRNVQAWVFALITVVMLLVIWFSGKTAPKERPKVSPVPPATDPNPRTIEDLRRRIEEEAKKARREQERLAALQSGGEAGASAPREQIYSRSAMPSSYGDRGYADTNSQRNWGSSEDDKRESRAPFASNIVLSFREQPKAGGANDAELALMNAETVTPFPAPPRRRDSPPADADKDGDEQKPSDKPRKSKLSHPHREGEKDYPLFEGTVLETVLTNRLDGYFSGPAACMVTTDVYSPNGIHLLIPQGSTVLGEVKHVDTFGQQRLAVVFHRLIMPDGYSVQLDQFQGLNQIGETGLRDKVNNHYLQLFGVSLAIGAIAGLAQANTRYGVDVSGPEVYEQGVASSLSQSSLRILDRYLNVLPTFTIREGHRVKIYLTQDLMLPAYDKHAAQTESEALEAE
jgi:type IV secretory pathway VirB10-like protein